MSRASVFIGYSPKDAAYLEQLNVHLSLLERSGIIEVHHERNISAGSDWRRDVDLFLTRANIIILLISADFIASDFCYIIELEQAMMRHRAGLTHVIPVIVRDCDWKHLSLGNLKSLPTDSQSIGTHPNPDSAWTQVADQLRRLLIERSRAASSPASRTTHSLTPPGGGYDPAWYIPNAKYEHDILNHLDTPGMPAVLRAPTLYGKSWLIQNIHKQLTTQPRTHACLVNLRALGPLTSADELFTRISQAVVQTLTPTTLQAAPTGKSKLSASIKFSLLLEQITKQIASDERLVLILDHADSAAGHLTGQSNAANDLFGFLRAITEQARTDEKSVYRKLRLLLSISYSPAFLLNGVNQSLFNFVEDIRLRTFSQKQLASLGEKYGMQATQTEIGDLYSFLGGHPYLSSRAFYYARLENCSLGSLVEDWQQGNFDMFDEHLRRLRSYLERLDLLTAVQQFKKYQRADDLTPNMLEVLQRIGVLKARNDGRAGYDFHSTIYRHLAH